MKHLQMKHLQINRIVILFLILSIAIPVFAHNNEEPELLEPAYHFAPFFADDIDSEEDLEIPYFEEEYSEEEFERSLFTAIDSEQEYEPPQFTFIEIEEEEEEFDTPQFITVVEVEEEYEIPQGIKNNKYYLESLRLTKLAHDTYEYGDYEASLGFAEDAVRNAVLSDEYVASQLIAESKRLVDWADFYKIAERNPHNVQLGKDHYENAVAFFAEEDWNQSSDSAIKSIEVLSVLQAGTGTVTPRPPAVTTTTPATTTSGSQYTVRTWAVERDCFWTISGYDWVYGDPWQWRKLYEANKDKIPNPNNPDLVEPGTVLDIPR